VVTGTACSSCGHPAGADDNFCEACRAELSPIAVSDGGTGPAACPDDPAAAVTPEGFCEACGRKLPAGRDHVELNLGLIAGVTDRGLRHRRNEDAMALATAHGADGPAVVAVVCDGVSTASRPDEASLAAVRAAAQVLVEAARKRGDEDTATAKLGRAVKLAEESGNTDSARLLAKVVDVVDAATGTVRLKKKVNDADAMALDTRSTKTVRTRK
jgi:PPM family protein phosphatase